MRSIFQMGVPVSGKNLFPSNIQGLPTWFTIRASKYGYIGRKKEIDFLVAMNAETAREDVMSLESGAAVRLRRAAQAGPVALGPAFLSRALRQAGGAGLPAAEAAQAGPQHDLRRRAGALVGHRPGGNPQSAVQAVRSAQGEGGRAELGRGARRRGVRRKAPDQDDPFRIERMDRTRGKIIIDGNAATALGAIFAGVTVVTWYPITPSSSLVESMMGYLKRYRTDPETGKATYAVVQAEDELAAIGMVIGAGWAGARAMTATAGPAFR
jgi:2-oxoglutarate ferredoxin oxidoreductase subunit alpha